MKRIADRITVLRDGETRGTFDGRRRVRGRDPAPDHRPRGRSGVPRQARRPTRRRPPLLEVAALSGPRFRDVRSTCGPARSSASPASRATASASSCARWPGCCPAHGTVRARAAEPVSLGRPGRAQRGRASSTFPATATPRACCCRCRVRENVSLLALDAWPRGGVVQRAPRARAGRRPRSSAGGQDARRRDAGRGALGRQPAEGRCSRARCSPSPTCCWPTSRRAASMRAPASSSTGCCARAADGGQAVVVLSSDASSCRGSATACSCSRAARSCASSTATRSPRRTSPAPRSPRRPRRPRRAAPRGARAGAALPALRRRRLPAERRCSRVLIVGLGVFTQRREQPLPHPVQPPGHAAARERARVRSASAS